LLSQIATTKLYSTDILTFICYIFSITLSNRNGVKMKDIKLLKGNKFYFNANCVSPELDKLFAKATILNETVTDLPVLPAMAAKLRPEVIYSSIAGTAAIEGNPMTDKDVEKVAKGEELEEYTQKHNQEIKNLIATYKFLDKFKPKGKPYVLTEKLIFSLHEKITKNIPDADNIPGKYRTGMVEVGDKAHGGVYKPPFIKADIEHLMSAFIEWINAEEILALNPFPRAFFAHYYFCKIHPFWDGNGRTGRLIEALLLQSSNIRYVPREMSNFYYKNVDDYYIAFSKANKLKKDATPFLEFCAIGAVESLQSIKKAVVFHIKFSLLKNYLRCLSETKRITKRQHELLTLLFEATDGVTLKNLHNKSPFNLLYNTVSVQTARRDLKVLTTERLLFIGENEKYYLNYDALENRF